MIKKIFLVIGVVAASFMLISWGGSGHYTINKKTTESFPVSMNFLMFWADSLAEHGSDADDRKSWDPDESMKHYIDIDNYPEFVNTGRIPSTFDSVVTLHGVYFVENEGVLPWSTFDMYNSLKMAFHNGDWHLAMLYASDLGHYVGDGHMPLHITNNYNGQLSGQTGIHSRYESSMVGYNIAALSVYSGDSVHLVTDVQKYIFNYIYANYTYIDSVLIADDYAQALAGNDNSATYYQALFAKTKTFTTRLFHNASHALAELIYTAWTEAGSPQTNSNIDAYNTEEIIKLQVFPNPVSEKSVFVYSAEESTDAVFKIFDVNGSLVKYIDVEVIKGQNKITTNLQNLANGLYLATLTQQSKTISLRFIVQR